MRQEACLRIVEVNRVVPRGLVVDAPLERLCQPGQLVGWQPRLARELAQTRRQLIAEQVVGLQDPTFTDEFLLLDALDGVATEHVPPSGCQRAG